MKERKKEKERITTHKGEYWKGMRSAHASFKTNMPSTTKYLVYCYIIAVAIPICCSRSLLKGREKKREKNKTKKEPTANRGINLKHIQHSL